LSWLSNVSDTIIQEVINIAEEKTHVPGDYLIRQGESGEKGMVIIARGAVKIMFGDQIIDLLGAGSVIGEMSVLAGVPRTANVIADSPVTALWLSSKDMHEIIVQSTDIEHNLWTTAGLRFAENILGKIDPYRQWSQIKMRRWLSNGEVFKTRKDENLKLHKKIAVLITGVAVDKESSQIYQAPCLVDTTEANFSENAWVFVCDTQPDAFE